MMMSLVKCSDLRDYWREKSFTYCAGIAELFTYNRFSALLRNLHFANNAMQEDGGDQPTAEEREAEPKLRNWKVAKVLDLELRCCEQSCYINVNLGSPRTSSCDGARFAMWRKPLLSYS